ncbi:nucleic acid binding protein [Anaeramoeba ignava]|uniref:Nucleic acid binding protein n=1 Tax=Anaeramoeba ignava TaxID=1746090 RepID=A0A9Q0LG06_ANAIG|nr:nucleic acid binding protein [Anaeramoeba ignava]
MENQSTQSYHSKTGKQSTLYVGNLPFSVTSEELEKEFGNFGQVIEARVMNRNGRPAGFAFIEMKTPQDAQSALTEMDGVEVDGRKIRVEYVRPKQEFRQNFRREPFFPPMNFSPYPMQQFQRFPRFPPMNRFPMRRKPFIRRKRRTGPKQESKTQIHVSNLPFNLTDEGFKKIFDKLKVKEARIARTRVGRSKGFGFVDFETHEDQEKALNLNGTETDGRQIWVKVAFLEVKHESKTQIHVSNLSFEMTDEDLQKFFDKLKVKEARIARTRIGRSKGFGFVDFETHEDQQKALKLDGKEFDNRKITIKVAFEQPTRKESKTQVHVSNLPFKITDEELQKLFAGLKVKEARVAKTINGRSKGFAFVNFETHEDQQKALKLDGKEIDNRTIGVRIAFEQPKLESNEDENDNQ